MPKYRKKPVIVEAVQLTSRVEIETLEGTLVGQPGDYLITGVRGEPYPCKPDIFHETYEPVDADTPTTFQSAMKRVRDGDGEDD